MLMTGDPLEISNRQSLFRAPVLRLQSVCLLAFDGGLYFSFPGSQGLYSAILYGRHLLLLTVRNIRRVCSTTPYYRLPGH